MRKLLILFVAVAAFVLPVGAQALCYFNFTGCDYDDCGFGCTPYGTGLSTCACYQSMDQCCMCVHWPIYCHCTFGDGTGHGSNWYVYDPGDCSPTKGICIGSMSVEYPH